MTETAKQSSLLRRLHNGIFDSVTFLRFDIFARLLVLSFLYHQFSWFSYGQEWLTDFGFHYTEETIAYLKPAPLPTMPIWLVPFAAIAVFGAGIFFILGKGQRFAAIFLTFWAVYIQRVDIISAFTLNKLYIVFFALIALAPRPTVVVDYHKREGKGKKGKERVETLQFSAWPLRVAQATILIQYFTAGLCKIFHGDWLPYQNIASLQEFWVALAAHSDVLWSQAQGVYRTDIAAWMLNTLPFWVWPVQMYISLAFEIFAPILFLVKRLRPIALILGFGFHLMIALTMEKLSFFSLQLLCFYALFIKDQYHELVIDYLRGCLPKK